MTPSLRIHPQMRPLLFFLPFYPLAVGSHTSMTAPTTRDFLQGNHVAHIDSASKPMSKRNTRTGVSTSLIYHSIGWICALKAFSCRATLYIHLAGSPCLLPLQILLPHLIWLPASLVQSTCTVSVPQAFYKPSPHLILTVTSVFKATMKKRWHQEYGQISLHHLRRVPCST